MSHSLTCVMGAVTDPLTSRVKMVRVCSYCERDKKEGAFLRSYLKQVLGLGMESVTHGICPACYQAQLEALKLA